MCGSQCCRVQSEAEQLQYAGLCDLLVVGLPCRVCNLSLPPDIVDGQKVYPPLADDDLAELRRVVLDNECV